MTILPQTSPISNPQFPSSTSLEGIVSSSLAIELEQSEAAGSDSATAGGRKFFIQTPIQIGELGLSPPQFRLYQHYVRVGGKNGACYEHAGTTAAFCGMSVRAVYDARQVLEDMGLITCWDTHDRGGYKHVVVQIHNTLATLEGAQEAFVQIPAVVDWLGLSSHEYRVYWYYVKVCGADGECREPMKTTAVANNMSVRQLKKVRQVLEDLGLIICETKHNKRGYKRLHVRVRDVWPVNEWFLGQPLLMKARQQEEAKKALRIELAAKVLIDAASVPLIVEETSKTAEPSASVAEGQVHQSPKAKCISRRRPSASVAAINRSLLEIDPNSETDLTTGEVGSSTASHSVFAFSQSTREQIARADLHGVENPQDEGGQTAVADEEVSTGEQAQSAALLMSGWFEGGNGEAEGLRSRTTAQTLAAAFTYDEIERTIFAVRNDVKAQSPGAIVARLQGKYLGPLYQLTKRDRRSELYLSLHPEHAQEIEREDAAAALNPQMTAAEGMDYKSYAAQFEAAGII